MFLILIVLLFHVWSCQSSFSFFSGKVPYFNFVYVCFGSFILDKVTSFVVS